MRNRKIVLRFAFALVLGLALLGPHRAHAEVGLTPGDVARGIEGEHDRIEEALQPIEAYAQDVQARHQAPDLPTLESAVAAADAIAQRLELLRAELEKLKPQRVRVLAGLACTTYELTYAPTRIPGELKEAATERGLILSGRADIDAVPRGATLHCKVQIHLPDVAAIDQAVVNSGLDLPAHGCLIGILFYLHRYDGDLRTFHEQYPTGPNGKWKGTLFHEDKSMLMAGGRHAPGSSPKPAVIAIPTAVLSPGEYGLAADFVLLKPDGQQVSNDLVPIERYEGRFRVIEREPAAMILPGRTADGGAVELRVVAADWVVSPWRATLASEEARIVAPAGLEVAEDRVGKGSATRREGGPEKARIDLTLVDALQRTGTVHETVALVSPLRREDLAFRLEVTTGEAMRYLYAGETRAMAGITIAGTTALFGDGVADGASLPVCYDRLLSQLHFARTPRPAETKIWYRLKGPGDRVYGESILTISADRETGRLGVRLSSGGRDGLFPAGEYTLSVYHNDVPATIQTQQTFRFSLHPTELRQGDEPEMGVFRASQRGDTERVKRLIAAGAKLGSRRGGYAVYTAACSGHLEIVKALLKAGADPDLMVKDQANALCAAAQGGYQDVVAALLDAGAEIRCAGYKDLTALHFAVIGNRRKVIELLLRRGADPAAVDQEGRTAGYYAYWLLKDVDLAVRLGYTEAREWEAKKNRPAVDLSGFAEAMRSLALGLASARQSISTEVRSEPPKRRPIGVPVASTPQRAPAAPSVWLLVQSRPGAFPNPGEIQWRVARQDGEWVRMKTSGKWDIVGTYRTDAEARAAQNARNEAYVRKVRGR